MNLKKQKMQWGKEIFYDVIQIQFLTKIATVYVFSGSVNEKCPSNK
jgi:hypothetical protein